MTYVIVDLEMCNVPKGEPRRAFGWSSELIQIGAVALDETLELSDTFCTYVRPQFGAVDATIQRLTGITPEDTADAPTALQALTAFAAWLPSDAVAVSWSENDEWQIRRELEGKQIRIPALEALLDGWVDCQKTFGEKLNCQKCYRLQEALSIAAIDYEDGAHDALVDARNTALLFAKMQRESTLTLSRYYAASASAHSTFTPFAALLADLAG